MNNRIKEVVRESIAAKQALLADEELLEVVQQVVDACVEAFRSGRKVLFCGNGGSAADAQHLAGELSGRFYLDREPLFAEAMHVNTSFLTAVANDYSFEEAYARMVRAAGREGDLLFALSTSGNSSNILSAIDSAHRMGMAVVGMTGRKGGRFPEVCDYLLRVPSDNTPRIQECHILLGHIICELVEAAIFGQ
ncbi:MAG: D-sedoheptulose 7-phosphate isomerase [Phaeodactylibacter sp.]|nr:D-sedoheptulose 7-phosphate isomerase [Phaeodactylibacter sp.]MCB9263720.1 D-sedoheptulose 7-phosphate isomerase [Lewinellaceae bacterium]MCB9286873.1 D-sedoheptulose 7-phosphate isomerase [Lewinellaceae bacterium]